MRDLEATVLRPVSAWRDVAPMPVPAQPHAALPDARGPAAMAARAGPGMASPSCAETPAAFDAHPHDADADADADTDISVDSDADADADADACASVGLGPLMASAAPLVNLVPRLRRARAPSDVARCRRHLLKRLATFDQRASARGVPAATRHAARYALCTWLDETLARTTWGATADWTRQGLLVTLHQEGFGGEKVFALAERVLREPWRHAELVELLAVMLALGFEGRYALQPDGRAQLETWRDRLHGALRTVRGPAPELSPPSAPAGPSVPRSRRRAWVLAGLASLVVAAIGVDRLAAGRLQSLAAPIVAQLEGLQVPAPMPGLARPVTNVPRAPLRLRLRALLASEIAAGRVEVDEDGPQARITLVGDRCFAPGEAGIPADLLPVLRTIAQAIDQVPGRVLVTGHTDAMPLHASARFGDNTALSIARAQAAAEVLARGLREPGRIRAQGVGSGQPRAADDTPEHRARNRRVEVIVEDAT